MLKNKRGVSLISLVITIILIIILASITYFASVSAISKTNYTRYVNNVKNVEDAIGERLVKVRGETIPKGKLYTNGQIYNYIANGGSSDYFLLSAQSAAAFLPSLARIWPKSLAKAVNLWGG